MTGDRWLVPDYTWQVTCDTWQMTHDTWFGVNICSKFHLFSFYRLGVVMFWLSGGKGSLTQLINLSGHGESVCRTAPVTPGLLMILHSQRPSFRCCYIHYINCIGFQRNKKVEAQPRPFYSSELLNLLKLYTTVVRSNIS